MSWCHFFVFYTLNRVVSTHGNLVSVSLSSLKFLPRSPMFFYSEVQCTVFQFSCTLPVQPLKHAAICSLDIPCSWVLPVCLPNHYYSASIVDDPLCVCVCVDDLLIYNVVLVLGIQQTFNLIYIHICIYI